MTSQLNVDTIADKAGTGAVALTKQSAAKVRVTVEGDSSILESFGVSSITDSATGNNIINYTNSFSAQKAQQPMALSIPGTDVAERPRGSTITSGSMRIINEEVDTSTDRDPDELFFTAHGDLA